MNAERAQALDAESLIERLGRTLSAAASTTSVFGAPIERSGVVVVPVAQCRFGYGAGAGAGSDDSGQRGHGGGGGGGLRVDPVGWLEIRDAGVRFVRIHRPLGWVLAAAIGFAVGAWLPSRRRRDP